MNATVKILFGLFGGLAIGFVSAGLMSLPQSISIILGENIGTTMTAQIIAFKITDYMHQWDKARMQRGLQLHIVYSIFQGLYYLSAL